MNPKQSIALYLFVFEGHSHDEIANEMDNSVSVSKQSDSVCAQATIVDKLGLKMYADAFFLSAKTTVDDNTDEEDGEKTADENEAQAG